MILHRLARAVAAAAAILALALGAGFAAFVFSVHRGTSPPPVADGIVVLTGGAGRIEAGFRLLEDARAPALLISGVAEETSLAELLHRVGPQAAAFEEHVTLGRAATTTYGNAEETAEWARTRGMRTLIVVTSAYHMPRAMLELGRALPGCHLYSAAVQPARLGRLGSVRTLLAEYVKLLVAWAGGSRAMRQPPSLVRLHPVDNSVSG